jgi:hypothetical protein
MKRIDVVKKGDEWRGESNGRAVPGTRAPRKDEAVKLTADKAKTAREPVSVKIHKRERALSGRADLSRQSRSTQEQGVGPAFAGGVWVGGSRSRSLV